MESEPIHARQTHWTHTYTQSMCVQCMSVCTNVCAGEVPVRVINSTIFQVPKIQSKYNHLVNFHYCTCENMWRQETDVGLFSSTTSPLNLRQNLSLNLKHAYQAKLNGQISPRSTCLHPLSAQVTDICAYAWLLCRHLSSELKSTCLHSRHFTNELSPVQYFYFEAKSH